MRQEGGAIAKPLVGVVQYGAGNLGNVLRALNRLQFPHRLLEHTNELREENFELLLLPGVGAFRPAAERLARSGWADAMRDWAMTGRPLLGICIGMQLLCTRSSEDGDTEGLGLLRGDVRQLVGARKIPHMGWNNVDWREMTDKNLTAAAQKGQYFYFVHSYAVLESPDCAATTSVDNARFCSSMRRDNVAGFQFHPERSGPDGVLFLGNVIRQMATDA